MSKIKLLISGLPNCGKTTLLQDVKNCLVIARDGKKYPFPQAHVNVPDFTSVSELINIIVDKCEAYKDKYSKYPETIIIDSISKILLDIEGNILSTVSSFPYGKINTEIKQLMDFIENDLASTFNVILVSHALLDPDTGAYSLVNAGGSWGKKGGVLSEVDQAIFLEAKGSNRIVHLRNSKMCARTTVSEFPDKVDRKDFNLNDYLNNLKKSQSSASSFAL